MQKTKIDWCESSWNPITGCYHGCDYCYARNIAKRFSAGLDKMSGEKIHVLNDRMYQDLTLLNKLSCKPKVIPYPYGFEPTLHRYHLDDFSNKKGRNIFVCSMADMFGDWVPDDWIDEVMNACEESPQHNYLFLTKNPARYEKYKVPGRDNMWYGTSVCQKSDIQRCKYLPIHANRFVSIEPILEDLEIIDSPLINYVDWFIIGAETGNRKDKIVPERKWIEDIVNECRKANKPVFMKKSLTEIWAEPLIQEFPDGLKR